MPGLNKRQQEFRKQMKELEKVKNYKDIIDDHNSFYHNTAYDNEQEKKKEKRKRNNKIIIFVLIISFIMTGILLNLDKLQSKFNDISFNNSTKVKASEYKNINASISEIKQYKVAIYHKNFSKRVEAVNIIQNTDLNIENFYNLNSEKIIKQIEVINEMIYEFSNYIPEDINKNLHTYNLNLLEALNRRYVTALEINGDMENQNFINDYNAANQDVNNYNNLYRNELIKIFDDINMPYSILENGTITFTYKNID